MRRRKQSKNSSPEWVDAHAIAELFGADYQTVAHNIGIFAQIPKMNISPQAKRGTYRYHYPTALKLSERFLEDWLKGRREEQVALLRARIAIVGTKVG